MYALGFTFAVAFPCVFVLVDLTILFMYVFMFLLASTTPSQKSRRTPIQIQTPSTWFFGAGSVIWCLRIVSGRFTMIRVRPMQL